MFSEEALGELPGFIEGAGFLEEAEGQLILNLLNGIDRISEDKISAAMLRKFVNGVYDILRNVKIPSCCRRFLL